jgi:hypothetical protein
VLVGDNLPPSSANVMESGILNLPKPSGPHRTVIWMLYLYLLPIRPLINIMSKVNGEFKYGHVSVLNMIYSVIKLEVE